MSIINQVAGRMANQSLPDGKTFFDADTLIDGEGNKFRLAGVQAPEVEKFTSDGYDRGTAGGQVATETIANLANSQGFTNVVPVLDENGEPMVDNFGRQIVDLRDSTGKSFESALLEAGVMQPTTYETTSEADRLTYELGELRRNQKALRGEPSDTEWDKARDVVLSGMEDEGHKQMGFRETALNEKQLALANQYGYGHYYQQKNVQFRDPGRSLSNESLNPFSDSWEQGWLGVAEGAYGMANLLGESWDIDPLAEFGEQGVERIHSKLQTDFGTTLTDWRDVHDISDGWDFVTNNMAMSLPYMIGTVGAVGVGTLAGGPVGAAIALSPGLVYAGQTWNEMEGEKNAGIALASGLAQATLDRLGIGFITGTVKGVGGKELLQRGVNELVKQGYKKEVAEKMVADASRKELAGFLGDAATIAKQQITAKKVGQTLAAKAFLGAGGEGLTEVGQETIAYTGATLGSEKKFDWGDLRERQLAAFVAGSALGGAFSVPGAAYDVGAWADVAVRQAPADARRLSQAGRYAELEVSREGRVKSVSELNEETTQYINDKGDTIVSLDERVDADRNRRTRRTFGESVGEMLQGIPSLWQGSVRYIVPDHIKSQSRAARKLADIFGGQLQRTFSGAAFENEKHHRVAIYKNMVPIPDKVFAIFNNGKVPVKKSDKGKISDVIYSQLRGALDAKGNFDPNLVPDGPQKGAILALQAQLQSLSDKMWQDQKKHNPDLGKLNNYLTRYKAFNKAAIAKNKTAFVEALVDHKGMDLDTANQIADAIASNPEINDFGEAFSAVNGEFTPGSHQRRTLDLAEHPAFRDFMETDLFANVSAAAKSAARYTTQQDYVGKNGEKVAALLQEMQDEGVAPEVVNKVAAGMKNYLDAESGNYKRAQSKFGKDLEKVQKNFMTWSTLAGLPLATISSFVELALTQRGLTQDQITGKNGKGGLKAIGRELGGFFDEYFGQIADYSVGRAPSEVSGGRSRLRELGFYEWDVGAATVSGTTEINAWQQSLFDKFFKATGLTQWTNYTRAVRAAIAGDYINDKLQLIIDTDPDNPTNASQEARESLRNIGINVDDMLDVYRATLRGEMTPELEAILEENAREGTFNFINDAVALPQSANRPLIYQDPRFALFTQFQGFIATFTANHIPKLWGEYVKRGTPAMKYNAFAIMTTMIMLGFASQYLKDLIKYGSGENPYLDDPEYIQRGIRASGLLGTSERVLDIFSPIYEQRHKSPTDWLFKQATGESPAVANLARAAKGTKQVATGEFSEGARNLWKTAPVVSPLSAHLWEPKTQEWKFK